MGIDAALPVLLYKHPASNARTYIPAVAAMSLYPALSAIALYKRAGKEEELNIAPLFLYIIKQIKNYLSICVQQYKNKNKNTWICMTSLGEV